MRYALTAAAALFPALLIAQVHYNAVQVSPAVTGHYRLNGLAEDGTVVGETISGGDSSLRPFTWKAGITSILDAPLGGHGLGISPTGIVVGSARHASGAVRATKWVNGVLIDLGVPSDLSQGSDAYAMDGTGRIAGTVGPNGPREMFILDSGTTTIVPPSTTTRQLFPKAMNETGTVVGYETIGESARVFTWRLDTGLEYFHDGRALDVNDAGVVVGISGDQGFSYGFILEMGTVTYFSDGHFAGINNSGTIVGNMQAQLGGTAVVRLNGSIYDLNSLNDTPGWILKSANYINEQGMILASGTLNGLRADALLTPVPEPAGIVSIGLLMLLTIRRRRCRVSSLGGSAATTEDSPSRQTARPTSG